MSLTEIQAQFESEALNTAEESLRQSHLKDGPIGRIISGRILPSLSQRIAAYQARSNVRKDGVQRLLQATPADALALITIYTALQGLDGKAPTQTAFVASIGEAVEDRAAWLALKKQTARPLFKRITRALERRHASSGAYAKAVAHRILYVRSSLPHWTQTHRVQVGLVLAELFFESTSWFEIATAYNPATGRRSRTVQPTQELEEIVATGVQSLAAFAPKWPIMVVPPVDWAGTTQGGYLFLRTKLVRGPHRLEGDITLAHAAINRLQKTAWRINELILDLVEGLLKAGSSLGGLPSAEREPQPSQPWQRGETPLPAVLKAWKSEAARAHSREARRKGIQIAAYSKIGYARRLCALERFYYPHSLDYRGRVYPIPARISPQGDDLSRALLCFRDGVRIGEDRGPYWLAVHLANTFGEDKCSLADRVAWVERHTADIVDSAREPLDGRRLWCAADKPFQFLAAAMEWAGYQQQGPDFLTHQPIAIDGTCNGLQHFAALTRDQTTGASVNLVPAPQPQDVYSAILDETMTLLRARARDEADARAWLESGMVDRPLVKRPVMTIPYGVTKYGMGQQIYEEIQSRGVYHKLSAQYLAGVILDAVGISLRASLLVQGWLKGVVQAANQAKVPLRWTTPAGCRVVQHSLKYDSEQVEVLLYGKRLRARLASRTNTLDTQGQMRRACPNFVHSLDAAHLMLTVTNANLNALVAVHDSYGTPAPCVDHLNNVLRKTFVSMYTQGILRHSCAFKPGLDRKRIKEFSILFAGFQVFQNHLGNSPFCFSLRGPWLVVVGLLWPWSIASAIAPVRVPQSDGGFRLTFGTAAKVWVSARASNNLEMSSSDSEFLYAKSAQLAISAGFCVLDRKSVV